ncbi:MAG: MotA/TolQ/ExbB proton channel family protein [Myxococcota bacterium]
MIERAMNGLALLGSEWVLWLLISLSIVSVAIMIERALFYAARKIDGKALVDRLLPLLEKGDVTGAKALLDGDSMESHVGREALSYWSRGADTVKELMEGELLRQRARFERRLIFLGTLGNNAPFIGLFGTVLGIIRAFRDLAVTDPTKTGANAQAVMFGISEALVATAVGLAVALPAVVAFNYFKSVVKGKVTSTEAISRAIYASVGAEKR